MWSLPAWADNPAPILAPVALVPVQRTPTVELTALTLDADIADSGGRTTATGYSTFKLHNSDKTTDAVLPVGLPAWAGDPYIFDPTRFESLSVSIEGKKVNLTPSRAEIKVGSGVRTVDWYTFTLTIPPDEKRTVRVDFSQNLGDGVVPRFAFGLRPASAWKGSIGSARLSIHFPASTALEQIVASEPSGSTFDGSSITWLFLNHEAPVNPSLLFIRPSAWNDLAARRRALQQNPDDANAHAALGTLLRQLGQVDSPRSESFTLQAIAEFETAARLDPRNRSARQALGTLYESRAGPAAGPRQAAYVALAAAQWEALAPSDAAARKQLAEDYFFLAVEAQASGAFEKATEYLGKAAATSPAGAGPLFTSDKANLQRRSLSIAWARSLLEKGDVPTATAKARPALGDAFMAASQPPPFFVNRAQVTTSMRSRTIVVRLVPLALQPPELKSVMESVTNALESAGAQTSLQPSSDGTDMTLTLTAAIDPAGNSTAQLAAIAKAVPNGAEWSLLRALIVPKSLVANEQDQIWSVVTEYREQVDLSSPCGALGAQLNAINQNLAQFDKAAPTDNEAQLKRALLQTAQAGWQRALSNGSVLFQAGGNQAQVEACSARTLNWSSSTPRLVILALVAGILAGVGLGALALLVKTRHMPEPGARGRRPDKSAP